MEKSHKDNKHAQISQLDLDRVLKLIKIRNDRIDLMQFCAAMHMIIAKMRLSVDIPSILPADLANTLFKKKIPPPKPSKTQKPRVKSMPRPAKPCKSQKPRIRTELKSRHDLKPLEIEDSHWVSDYTHTLSSTHTLKHQQNRYENLSTETRTKRIGTTSRPRKRVGIHRRKRLRRKKQ